MNVPSPLMRMARRSMPTYAAAQAAHHTSAIVHGYHVVQSE